MENKNWKWVDIAELKEFLLFPGITTRKQEHINKFPINDIHTITSSVCTWFNDDNIVGRIPLQIKVSAYCVFIMRSNVIITK